MNQIKYPAYAMLLVFGIASVALFINKFSSVPSGVQTHTETKTVTTSAKKEVKNAAGRNLFQNNCQICHSVNKNLTGPALAGVENRGPWKDKKMLIKWVKNPASMMNDAYAKELLKQYNGQLMPSFSQLSDRDIENIFAYVKEAESAAPEIVQ